LRHEGLTTNGHEFTRMNLQPSSLAELSNLLGCANTRGEKVSDVNLSKLNRVLEHTPEDMTVTVEAGLALRPLQAELGKRGQWLPIDPPHADKLTVSDLISRNVSGPRRFGYGTIGDYLIGMKAVLADGRVIQPGGKVVKNVAGYDLAKLFIGGRGTLGIVAEATFKLRPLPEAESFVAKTCASLEDANATIESVLNSEITPVVLDLHSALTSQLSIVLSFAGTREEVDWQMARAHEIGFKEKSSLEYEARFWAESATVQRISVLPSKIIEAIRELKGTAFVARAGNGIIYHRGAAADSKENLPLKLMQRLKDEFDPKHILPELPW
jgi:FAD/FMN-containing dehydrogenase